MKKFLWYLQKCVFLCIVFLRIFVYCLIRPKKFYALWFRLFSSVNEFYQVSHGRLLNFQKTNTYQEIKKNLIFAETNIYNIDSKVSRPMETPILATLVRHFQPKTIFEIGTYDGYTTLHFAKNANADCVVYTLDLPVDLNAINKEDARNYSYDDMLVAQLSKKHRRKRMYDHRPEKKKIHEINADSRKFDFSRYYGKMDFVFIDGNHSYPYVKSDTENAMRMLSENGVIVWHDFDYIIHRDIFKYLNRLSSEYKIYAIPNTRFAVYGRRLT